MSEKDLDSPQAWWRFGHVWLVIAGPALVIVASFITLYLAVSSPNEIVTDEIYRQSVEINRKKGVTTLPDEQAPAMQARNHATTGAVPTPTK